MARCLNCSGTFSCPSCKPEERFQPAASNVGNVVAPCPDKAAATILVRNRLTGVGIEKVGVTLVGAGGPPVTDAHGFAHWAGLDPKEYVAKIDFESIEDRYALPSPGADTLTKTIAAGGYEFYIFELEPLTTLEVTVARADRDGIGVKKAKVRCTGAGGLDQAREAAADDGKVVFKGLAVDAVELSLVLEGDLKQRFQVDERFAEQTRVAADSATRSVALDRKLAKHESKFLVAPLIYLKLQYEDPEQAVHAFPKDFALKVTFFPGNVTRDVKVLDDNGNLRFTAEKNQTEFTLDFESDKVRLLSHTAGQPKAELLVDQTEDQMRALAKFSKPFFSLPLKWKLINSTWETEDLTLPATGKIAIPIEGVGTEATPGRLRLKPKLQYVRFQFHDRKFARNGHSEKQVHVPAVIVKAARNSDNTTGAPIAPTGGTHDAVGSWILDKADNAKGCQAIVWVLTKTDAGAELPKLDKEMLIEFGWENGFVVSNSATARTIETLGANDPRRKPGRLRNALYDLPKLWRSKYYYTRLPGGDTDPTKNRFFDKLSVADIEKSLVRTTPLVFSLDDIVLVKNDGSQAVKDQNEAESEIALSKYSRFALLHLDPTDKFHTKIWQADSDAVYHTKRLFAKENDADVYRNVLVEYPFNARAVLFCNQVHDIFDKRSESASHAGKAIVGARAAKASDADISAPRRIFNQNADAFADTSFTPVGGGAGFVHMPRQFPIYYLHYGDTDGTTVYGILLTHYAIRFHGQERLSSADVGRPWSGSSVTSSTAQIENYRKAGLKLAMERWNGKKYFLEENDDKKDFAIRPIYLFEAKDVWEGATRKDVGGKHHCLCAVGGPDEDGSSANPTEMYMRKSGYKAEGAGWGSSPPGGDAAVADYDGTTSAPRNALAHELGHAAVGMFDDYLTAALKNAPPSARRLASDLPSYAKPQRFPGVPYNLDPVSIMSNNRAVRLRSMWGRTLWVNASAKAGQDLHKFLGGKVFRAAYEANRGKLKYFLNSAKSIYQTAQAGTDVALGENGKANLYLYELGEDEFAHWMQNGPYDAILVVDWHLCVAFVDVPTPVNAWVQNQLYTKSSTIAQGGKYYACTGAHGATNSSTGFATDLAAGKWQEITPENWDNDKKKDWIEDINKRLTEEIEGAAREGRFKLTSSGRYKKVYVRSFVQWDTKALPADANPAGTHFAMVVKADGTSNFSASGTTINLGNNANGTQVLRYILGRHTAVANKTSTLTAADMSQLKVWVETQTGAPNSVQAGDIPITVTGVEPVDGAGEGGDVVIKGTNFDDVTSVKFGAVDQASFTKTSTEITTKVPSGAVTAKVKVASANRSAESPANYKILPSIGAVSPNTPLAVGAAVTVHGKALTGASALKFGAVAQPTFSVVSAVKITTTVPAGAVTSKIEVTTPGGKATSPDDVVIVLAPTIASFAPTSAKVGDRVTIQGANLDNATEVKIGGVAATVSANSAGQIVAEVGVGAASGSVEVTTAGGKVTRGGYTLAT